MSAISHKKNELLIIEKILKKQQKNKIDPIWLKQLISAIRLVMEQSDLKYGTSFNTLSCFSSIETMEKINPAQMIPIFSAITEIINNNQHIFNMIKKIPDHKYQVELKKVIHKVIAAINYIRYNLYQKIPKELL